MRINNNKVNEQNPTPLSAKSIQEFIIPHKLYKNKRKFYYQSGLTRIDGTTYIDLFLKQNQQS